MSGFRSASSKRVNRLTQRTEVMLSLASDGARLVGIMRDLVRHVLQIQLLVETREHILPIDLLNLSHGILLNELVDAHEASADAHQHLIALANLDVHALATEVIYTFGLAQE